MQKKSMGLISLCALSVFILISTDAGACTSFAFPCKGRLIFGTNYDNSFAPGLIFVNMRNVKKNGWEPGEAGQVASWVSKYGSIAFTCVGYQLAWGGMNEKGLTISTMALSETVNPVSDDRPPLVSPLWMQYILDTCATVEEVLRSDREIRITDTRDHYLVCDRQGNCAAVEFLDGKMVCHTAGDLPVRALANRPYSDCVESWKRKEQFREDPYDSRSRFIRVAEMIAEYDVKKQDAVKYAFRMLESLRSPRNPESTRWSIVFDTGNLEIHYRSFNNPRIRRIVFKELDFECDAVVKMLEVHNDFSGDVTGSFKPYSHNLSLDFLLKAVKSHRPDYPQETLPPLLEMMEKFPCLPAK